MPDVPTDSAPTATAASTGQSPSSSRHIVQSVLRFTVTAAVDLLLFIILFLFILAPLTFKMYPDIPKHIVYLNGLKIPSYFADLSDPVSFGLNFTRNMYLSVDEEVIVGVWHTLPKSLEVADLKPEDFEKSLSSSKQPIMLYCHGNSLTRAASHRIDLYKLLAGMDFHVVALDYRGYGDSSGIPTSENGLVTDVVTLYLWLREKAGPDVPIYVWGHSLGTAISTKALKVLNVEKSEQAKALILEAPFNNLLDGATTHPLSRMFSMLWWFYDVLHNFCHTYDVLLQTDENIQHVNSPVLILHAEDDEIIPVELAVKLHEASRKRPESFPPVKLHIFPYDRGLQHKYIHKAEELPTLIRKFLEGK